MNERLKDVATLLVDRIHDVIKEKKVTEQELKVALQFLTEVGERGEYQLLSDVLGVSVLVDELTHGQEAHDGITSHNVEGPLYRSDAPLLDERGMLCSEDEKGEMLIIKGRVLSVEDQQPIANAELDVWQANENGYYENQDEDQVDYNLRGRVLTDENGQFTIRTIVPGPYEIAKGGPIGGFLANIERHDWRPAHIHFRITSEHFSALTTMLFVPNDPWIDSDAIGAVKDSLIMNLEKIDNPYEWKQYGVDRTFNLCTYNFHLKGNRTQTSSTLQNHAQTH